MQNIEDFKKEIIAFASSLNSDILLPKISRVSVDQLDQVISLDLAPEELSAFNLPRQYVYGKIVRLPSNFKPQQKLHFSILLNAIPFFLISKNSYFSSNITNTSC